MTTDTSEFGKLFQFYNEKFRPHVAENGQEDIFMEHPLRYLENLKCPVLSVMPDKQKQLSLATYKNFTPTNVKSLNCTLCSAFWGAVFSGIIIVGAIATAVVIQTLALALAPITGGLSEAVAALAILGIVAGVLIAAAHLNALVNLVCRTTGDCG